MQEFKEMITWKLFEKCYPQAGRGKQAQGMRHLKTEHNFTHGAQEKLYSFMGRFQSINVSRSGVGLWVFLLGKGVFFKTYLTKLFLQG